MGLSRNQPACAWNIRCQLFSNCIESDRIWCNIMTWMCVQKSIPAKNSSRKLGYRALMQNPPAVRIFVPDYAASGESLDEFAVFVETSAPSFNHALSNIPVAFDWMQTFVFTNCLLFFWSERFKPSLRICLASDGIDCLLLSRQSLETCSPCIRVAYAWLHHDQSCPAASSSKTSVHIGALEYLHRTHTSNCAVPLTLPTCTVPWPMP